MRISYWLFAAVMAPLIGCSSGGPASSVALPVDKPTELSRANDGDRAGGRFLSWGFYHLSIARDGSSVEVVPERNASSMPWGYHLNVVKLLEDSPCANCLTVSNVHKLPDGNLSMDVSLTHPYPGYPQYTGFDVRGIIMFPSSQYYPDDELRLKAGYNPYQGPWHHRFAWSEKGDAELMNPDGWTTIYAPDFDNDFYMYYYPLQDGYPIFDYYKGKYASGENLGTINAFIRFYSNENRHMFEVGKTVTRTYIIKPPASGPIQASYAIYAHWAEPLKMPVTNPAQDFGPDANSPMPYDFQVIQDGVIDPDAPNHEQAKHLIWHIKTWSIPMKYWTADMVDLPYLHPEGEPFQNHPNGQPDDYLMPGINVESYAHIPGGTPGKWPVLFRLFIHDPEIPSGPWLGMDWYILDVDIGVLDGNW